MTLINDQEKLTPSQAFKHLVAMRALLPEDAPSVVACRRRRDNKLVHASLQVNDLVWFYHRGKIGGSYLHQLPLPVYDATFSLAFFNSMKTTWHPRHHIRWDEIAPSIHYHLYVRSPSLTKLLKKP